VSLTQPPLLHHRTHGNAVEAGRMHLYVTRACVRIQVVGVPIRVLFRIRVSTATSLKLGLFGMRVSTASLLQPRLFSTINQYDYLVCVCQQQACCSHNYSVRLFSTTIQYVYLVRLFSTTIQYVYSVRLFSTIIQYDYTVCMCQ